VLNPKARMFCDISEKAAIPPISTGKILYGTRLLSYRQQIFLFGDRRIIEKSDVPPPISIIRAISSLVIVSPGFLFVQQCHYKRYITFIMALLKNYSLVLIQLIYLVNLVYFKS
jgi:hypothetical protein